ncbi:hypothetical protein KZO25_16470 [Halomonas sp. ANAO-440]|uniref:hypothetical protein n=1 Tax=Halomonas sp. ANAO-440 TaxID=2861360 RepID=UPI001CAA52D9|nr:hypothetical protein [Halomonas sp. ANAO-440]MBZ0331913.1 hypothetical protein [Halomonas sp. ANAO-440]
MPYPIPSPLKGINTNLHIMDATSVAVRLGRESPRQASPVSDEEEALRSLRHEVTIQELLRRRFLRTTEQYLKGELDDVAIPRMRR